jgi:hypothetical protein
MKILLLHSAGTQPGVHPVYLSKRGHEVWVPALPDNFGEAVRVVQSEIDQRHPDVIVGSSRGGAVAMNAKSGSIPLVLLSPAWRKHGASKSVKRGTAILHSRRDEAVSFVESEELVRNSSLPESALVEVGTDHRLADPDALAAMLAACLATRPRVLGCDFGVPKKAGDQAKKIILVEAVRLAPRYYAIEPSGRNARLVGEFARGGPWKENRRGWTLPDLSRSLRADASVQVAAFDFPFSIPAALLTDGEFARLLGQSSFRTRASWARFVSARLRLELNDDTKDAELQDLSRFATWRDKRFWLRRATDAATNGSAPLKHKYQNVFAMTLAGTALLTQLGMQGYTTVLGTAQPASASLIETYPREVASRIGFSGSYKSAPDKCLSRAVQFLKKRGIRVDFDKEVRSFCETYRTSGKDPDGADAFLCLVTAIACSEGMAEVCDGQADDTVLREEGAIVVPTKDTP